MNATAHEAVHLLLVDDLEENLMSLEALLRRENLTILRARSGPEALELLLQYPVALALLDVQMPGMDGFELAELMRGTERTQRVPIIFLTAGSDDRQRRFRGYEAGAVDFLHKPIEPDILRSKVDVFVALARQQNELASQRDALQTALEENARLLKESRQYAVRLQEADKRKDEFLATMSHEIRTPMNAVVGLAHILAISEPLSERQKEFIRTLQTSADSLLGLINDLLDFAKIQSSTVELERVPFSLVTTVGEAIAIAGVKAQEKGLELRVAQECACVEHRSFLGDPVRLRQVILNLISNAIKFTERGRVTVTIRCERAEETNTETVILAVADTGIGIPADKLGSIFEKFVQADSSINRKFGGTGLGLAISKALIDVMGGTIGVSSVPGQGTTFTVTVPLRVAAAGAVPVAGLHPTAERPAAAKPRVLLVEDYAPNVLVAQTFLEEFGYQVDVAGTGQQAIDRAARERYRVILMDVQMSGMDGLEATRRIRDAERARGAAPATIIGMTAHALIGDRERCLAAGMSDYLTKPFDPHALRRKLDNALPPAPAPAN